VLAVAGDLLTCSDIVMPTAADQMRRQVLQRAVYARFKTKLSGPLGSVMADHAWMLAKHAVDAVMEVQANTAVAVQPATAGGEPPK
jgi:hypothetical protein